MAEKQNPMRDIRMTKITLNIGTGESGVKLEKAQKLLEKLTKKKVVITKTHDRTTFGMAKDRPIGVKVTLRKEDAKKFLKPALQSIGNKLKASQFDLSGSFSFGIAEYINIPGIKYDAEIGILGFDVSVSLERPGYRIKKRRQKPKKVGKKHQIKKEEAIEFAKKEWGLTIE